jgi:uncharacterized membrane protein YsdA (DUF1294 family)
MYHIGFSLLAIVLTIVLFPLLTSATGWQPYAVWLAVLSVVTLAMYGLDKALAILKGPRVPEVLLHVLALLGGFLGAWLGMALFRHKTNRRKHPWFAPIIVLSTLMHAVLIYLILIR